MNSHGNIRQEGGEFKHDTEVTSTKADAILWKKDSVGLTRRTTAKTEKVDIIKETRRMKPLSIGPLARLTQTASSHVGPVP